MTGIPRFKEFQSLFRESIENETFVTLTLAAYTGKEENLKNVYIKKILIKGTEKLSFTFRYKTRDIVKNYVREEAISQVQDYLTAGFRIASLQTLGLDVHFEIIHDQKIILKKKPASVTALPSVEHDKEKKRLIASKNKPYLAALNITDDAGNVYKNAQDKYRQINHYIEILSGLINELPVQDSLHIVDMGSGKGYLTFALYDYLQNVLKRKATVTGVEFRADLVGLCNTIAQRSDFENLNFVEGTIDQYENPDTNVLIALHACDTATDDAIAKGIRADADLILVAPCCHKQIRRQIEKNKTSNDVDFLTKYGIFLERQSEMVTDGIRALILEYYGYRTKVFEFISDSHTPKNVMIVGIRNQKKMTDQPSILGKIKEAKAFFGIEYHHLEKIMGM